MAKSKCLIQNNNGFRHYSLSQIKNRYKTVKADLTLGFKTFKKFFVIFREDDRNLSAAELEICLKPQLQLSQNFSIAI